MGLGSWVRDKWNDLKNWYAGRQERRRQRLRDEYYEYERRKYQELNDIYSYRNRAIADIDNDYFQSEKELRRLEIENKKNINKATYDNICNIISEQMEDTEKLINEISSVLEEIKATSGSQHNTYIRKKSIEKLRDDIYETMARLQAYKYYLSAYKKRRLDFVYERTGDIAEMFEFSLPENSLYNGKLIYIKKRDLFNEGKLKVNESMDCSYICNDKESIKDFDDESEVPVMAIKGQGFMFELSCAKGLFKSMAIYQPRIGFESTVEKYENNDLILDYYGLKLKLNKRNLFNPRRIPSRGSKIRVYTLRYRSDLSQMPSVTEKFEESLNIASLGVIPLVVPFEKIEEFREFISKNSLYASDLEWKVGPFREEIIDSDNRIKLQLGNQFVIKAEIVCENDGVNYLEYTEVLGNEELLKAQDIFVDMDITLKVMSKENIYVNSEIKQSFDDFLLFIHNEFSQQKLIKDSVEGIAYYNKWAEITGKLIEYLSKGRPLKCAIIYIEELNRKDYKTGLNVFRAQIENCEQVLEIIDKHYKTEFRTEYFILDENDNRYVVEFANDASYINIYGDFNIDCLTRYDYQLNVFPKVLPYPEITQRNALNTFREGRMANSKLKPFLLDGAKIEFTDTGDTVIEFFNKCIEENESQKKAVIKAFSEANIFMIQGPPGTGKTTVIKELIQQHLYKYPRDKILIVSQANVAVDNVLRGLIYSEKSLIDKDNIIRCGNEGSVSDDIKLILFENKKENYINEVKGQSFSDFEKEAYRQRWIEILDNPNESNLIGECILKNHQLVGVTCVGLEKKRLGLNEIIFDLVIVDEAGKALPGEILIPINRARKVILIGDHKQLPPVVNPALYDGEKCNIDDIVEDDEKDDFLNESFFKRLYESCPQSNKVMLNTQFRMPNVIGTMISNLFYTEKDDVLFNGGNTYEKEPIIFDKNLNIIDMTGVSEYREQRNPNSGPYNLKECNVVVKLIEFIRKKNYVDRIVVITPYKNQKRYLIKAVKDANLNNVDINTIDAFQGDESEIVIYCTTRALQKTDYFSYDSRLNVALSRAKNELIIIGTMKYFYSYGEGSNLYKIANYISEKGNIFKFNDIKELKNDTNELNITTDEFNNYKEAQQEVDLGLVNQRKIVSMKQVQIPEELTHTPPKRFKIDRAIKYYLENSRMSKPIEVIQLDDGGFMLKDGYARFIASRELKLEDLEVLVV